MEGTPHDRYGWRVPRDGLRRPLPDPVLGNCFKEREVFPTGKPVWCPTWLPILGSRRRLCRFWPLLGLGGSHLHLHSCNEAAFSGLRNCLRQQGVTSRAHQAGALDHT